MQGWCSRAPGRCRRPRPARPAAARGRRPPHPAPESPDRRPWVRLLVAGSGHDRISDGRDGRIHRDLGAALHRREGGLHAHLHGVGHHLLDLGIRQTLLHLQRARLEVVPGLGQGCLHLLLNALLNLLGRFLSGSSLQRIHQLPLERHIHQAGHHRHGDGLELGRHGLDHLAHCAQLLRPECAAAGHVLQAHQKAGALQVVGQIGDACYRIFLGLVDGHSPVCRDGIALDDDRLLILAQVLNDHAHQQLAHHGAAGLEVADHVRQRLICLLYLGLLLHATGGSAAPPRKPRQPPGSRARSRAGRSPAAQAAAPWPESPVRP